MKKDKLEKLPEEDITRKEALKKAGKYAAFTAGTMLFLFSPKESQASSIKPEDAGKNW